MASAKERKLEKRKAESESDDELEDETKKQRLNAHLSQDDFKNQLKDDSTVNDGLSEFVQVAKAHRNGQDCTDIVASYCSSSPQCTEIFDLLTSQHNRVKVGRITLVCECLTQILQYIQADDNSKLWPTADFIVEKMVSSHLEQLYFCLNASNKSLKIKAALQLLIAMVVLNKKAKMMVQAKFKFDNNDLFSKVFDRRDRKDPEDVRSRIVLFTMSFLVDADEMLINTIVQQRSFIQLTLSGLIYDPKEMVMDVLSTLFEKVVLNEAVPRQDKLWLFDFKCLVKLCSLHDWEGPRGWMNKEKSFLTDVAFLEERLSISKLVHEVLLAICSPRKHGLAFRLSNKGTDSRNNNPLMTRLLTFLSSRLDNPFHRKLAANILNFCPDQSIYFLPKWGRSLITESTENRIRVMDFLIEVYETQTPIPVFLSKRDLMPDDIESLVSLMVTYYLPCDSIGICIKDGIRHKDLPIRHQCLVLSRLILHNATAILSVLASHKIGHIPRGAFTDQLMSTFSVKIIQTLPPPPSLFSCVHVIMEILSDPTKLSTIGTEVDLVEHVSTVLRTLCLYQGLSPTLLSNQPTDVAKLVESVGRLQAIFDAMEGDASGDAESKLVLPQLDLLQLLSETDVEPLTLVQGGLLEKLLRSAHSLKEEHKKKTVALVYKVLNRLMVLSDHTEELNLWVGHALWSESRTDWFSSIHFLCRVVGDVIRNPVPYLDRVVEIASEVVPEVEEEAKNKGSSGKALRNPMIQDILDMDDEDLDAALSSDLTERSGHRNTCLSFSPLTIAAVEKLGTYDGDTNAAKEYVNAVMLDILHSQGDPTSYSRLVTACWEGEPSAVTQYIEYWGGRKRSQAMPSITLKLGTPYSCRLLNWFMCSDVSSDLDIPDLQELQAVPEDKILTCLKQAMLYLDHCFSDKCTLGQKIKRVKVLRNVITQFFTSFVMRFKKSETVDMEVDGEDVGSDERMDNPSHYSNEKVVEKISSSILLIANNPVVKDRCLTTPAKKGTSSPTKLDDNQKMNQSMTQLMCDVLVACRHLRLSSRCADVLNVYLDRALDRLPAVKGKDLSDCLTLVQNVCRHVHLPSINKCIYSFLKLPQSSFVNENVPGDEVVEVHKGQMSDNLASVGETFDELLHIWVKTLCLYRVANVGDTSISLSLSSVEVASAQDNNHPAAQETADSSSKINSYDQSPSHPQPSHVTSVHLVTSELSSLFDSLLISSKFDSSILSVVLRLPQIGAYCGQSVFSSLINHYSSLGKERRMMVEVLVSSQHTSFHSVCGKYTKKHVKAIFSPEGHFGLIRAYLQKDGVDPDVVQRICKQLLSSCEELLPRADGSLWPCVHMLVDRPDVPDTFLQDLFVAVAAFIPTHRSSTCSHHFSLLDSICRRLHADSKDDPSSYNKTETDYLELLLNFITHLSKRTERNLSMEEELIGMAVKSLPRGGVLSQDFMASTWGGFVKSVLKHMYTQHASLDLVAALTFRMFGKKKKELIRASCSVDPSIVFQMCISHTAFTSSLMSAAEGPSPARDSLINLLYHLFMLRPNCFTSRLLTPLVGAYTATLSFPDQQLLAMINACVLAECRNDFQLPILWGKAYLDQKASDKSLGQQTSISMDMVLAEIDAKKMEDTILHFSMKRNTSDFRANQDVVPNRGHCYDPSYLLRVFLQILSPKKVVPIRAFSDKDCLGFLLICLSSKHNHCRLMAYKCLNDFYAHLQNSPSPSRHEFAFILDILNASRKENGQRIPYIITLYLSRAIKLVLDPSDHMYLRVMKFLCHKPELNLSTLPEFFKFFFSPEISYLKERTWMLALLRDGLRDMEDYQMCRKCGVFKHVMSFYTSVVSDRWSKEVVLELIRNACRLGAAVKDLTKEQGLIPWLSCVVSGLNRRPWHVEMVADILDTVCDTLGVKGGTSGVEVVDCQGGFKSQQLGNEAGSSDGTGVTGEEEDNNNVDDVVMIQKGEERGGNNNKTKPSIPQSTLASLQMLVKFFNLLMSQRRDAMLSGSEVGISN